MKDYYALLGLDSNATKGDVKKSFRILANKYHPDKSDEPGTEAKFISITEAYDVLSNKKSRAQYDLYRWNELKQKQKAAESFTVVTPPFESTRSRRNKVQKKRSLKYHQEKEGFKKSLLLIQESIYVVGRYVFHLLGITLFSAILFSALSQLSDTFGENIIRGLVVAALTGAIVYGIYWISNNAYQEVKKDLDSFSVFYKISKKKAGNSLLLILSLVILLYVLILKSNF